MKFNQFSYIPVSPEMADDISFFSDLHLTKEKITNHILSDSLGFNNGKNACSPNNRVLLIAVFHFNACMIFH